MSIPAEPAGPSVATGPAGISTASHPGLGRGATALTAAAALGTWAVTAGAPPIGPLTALALGGYGIWRVYRAYRPAAPADTDPGARRPRWKALAFTLGWAYAIQLVVFGALLLLPGLPAWGGGRAADGPGRAELRLDRELAEATAPALEAARAAAARATTPQEHATAVDAYSDAATTAALADDLDALEQILDEQLRLGGGS